MNQYITTFKKRYAIVLLIIGSILLSSIAQVLLKLAMQDFHNADAINLFNFSASRTAIIWLFIGLGAYGLSMMLWMAALTRHELSFAYPLLSLSYILVYMIAVLLPQLHETVSLPKTLGIASIVIGVILVTKSSPPS